MLVIEESPHLAASAIACVERFVAEGGTVVLCGEAAPALLSLASVAAVPRAPSNRYRCMRLASGHSLLDRFVPDEVLFFTCSAFNALAPGRDFTVEPREAATIAFSQEITLADPGGDWPDSAPSDEPSLVMREFAGGGRVALLAAAAGIAHADQTPTVVGVSDDPLSGREPRRARAHGGPGAAAARRASSCACGREAPTRWRRFRATCTSTSTTRSTARGRNTCTWNAWPRLFRARGLDGKYTFCTTARVAEEHPDAVRGVANFDVVPHTYDDISLAGLGREEQAADIRKCIETFAAVIPDTDTYRLGWRTHTYGSDAVTREALAEAGYLWISDMGASWYGEWDFKRWPVRHTAYVAYPQRARGAQGQALPLWEMPECAPSDFALYESGRRHPDADWAVLYSPEEAERIWTDRLRLACLREELFILNWHPFLTLSEPDRAQTAERMLDIMRATPGVAFMTITEAAQWWDAREQVEVEQRESRRRPARHRHQRQRPAPRRPHPARPGGRQPRVPTAGGSKSSRATATR